MYEMPFWFDYGDYFFCVITIDKDGTARQIRDDLYGVKKQDWCPLKPLPEKKEYIVPIDNVESQKDIIAVGWNACIDEITGGNSND